MGTSTKAQRRAPLLCWKNPPPASSRWAWPRPVKRQGFVQLKNLAHWNRLKQIPFQWAVVATTMIDDDCNTFLVQFFVTHHWEISAVVNNFATVTVGEPQASAFTVTSPSWISCMWNSWPLSWAIEWSAVFLYPRWKLITKYHKWRSRLEISLD